MCTQTRSAPVLAAGRDGVVEVLRVVGVDREGGQRREVHARVGGVRVSRSSLGLGGGRPRRSRGAARGRASGPPPRRGRGRGGPARARTRAPRLPGAHQHAGRRPRVPRARPPSAARGRTAARPRGSARASRARPPSAHPGGRPGAGPRAAHPARSRTVSTAIGSASSRSVWALSFAVTCGLDPLAGDRLAVRQVVVGHGEVEHPAVREVDDLLDEALAVGARSGDRGAPAVAERAGHDLGGARAAAVHEHDDRHIGRDRVADCVLRAARAACARAPTRSRRPR